LCSCKQENYCLVCAVLYPRGTPRQLPLADRASGGNAYGSETGNDLKS
jgi:hypothetical protein